MPRFFIERLTQTGEVVYDPFMGRGTTVLEAALMGRVPWGNDLNPLSICLVKPRLNPPTLNLVCERLAKIDFGQKKEIGPEELLVFYHPATLRQICALKADLGRRKSEQAVDSIDNWIEMVALNRLTGHSPGFFSVYTLPPNQAVTVKRQRHINKERGQVPPFRDVPQLILKKTKALLAACDRSARDGLAEGAGRTMLLTKPASNTPEISDGSVSLVVTSPPFLDVVDYATDNWLRCWFLGIDASAVKFTVPNKPGDWQRAMTEVFQELYRIVRPGGHIAFEVGEVRHGSIRLEELAIPCGANAGLKPVLVLINQQEFTKTANCWGVDNNVKGTNTNRIALFQKT